MRRTAGLVALIALLFVAACGAEKAPERKAKQRQKAKTTTTTTGPAGQSPVATAAGEVTAYAEPSTSAKVVKSFSDKTSYGSPRVFLVVSQEGDWVHVWLPMRPNGAQGWVPSSQVSIQPTDYEVRVDTEAKRLTLLQNGKQVLEHEVAVGTGGTPTPKGTFFITDLLQPPDPDGPYGPYAYGLSGYSEVLSDFAGGDGQIGLHGTNNEGSIGKNASHGCVRLPNDVITELSKKLPLGTPVVIS